MQKTHWLCLLSLVSAACGRPQNTGDVGQAVSGADQGVSQTAVSPVIDDAITRSADMGKGVRLGRIPSIVLASPRNERGVTDERIRKLINDLADIDSPDYGFASTIGGQDFSPVPGHRIEGGMLFTDHELKRSEALCNLVKLGPRALPFLLASLDNHTPTKLTVEHRTTFGGMSYDRELDWNPVNESESNMIRSLPNGQFPHDGIKKYTLKIGDVCFVAIGQIVGRDYEAVRYQPTACIVVNSVTHDAQLRDAVRTLWSSDNAEQTLFDSLLRDYSTEGVVNGRSLDGWDIGSSLQVSAALRLVYYYPRDSASLIAGRLRTLRVERVGPGRDQQSNDQELEAYMKREVANGVRAGEFVAAVAWSDEPAVRAALDDVATKATDTDVLRAIRQASPVPER